MKQKKRIVVICPGRGTYTRETSGYLKSHGGPARVQIDWMDSQRYSEKTRDSPHFLNWIPHRLKPKFTWQVSMHPRSFMRAVWQISFPLTAISMRL